MLQCLILKIILHCSLQQTQVGSPVFNTPRPLARHNETLFPPPFHVAPPKHLVSRPLAYVFGVVAVVFEHLDDSCGKVVQESVVWDELVHKFQKFHMLEN